MVHFSYTEQIDKVTVDTLYMLRLIEKETLQ